jgi:non-ribosomal peptide synthetase component F
LFVNLVPLRINADRRKTFGELLQDVKGGVLEAYENQEYPFENLLERMSVKRDNSRHPVFDVVFNLVNQRENRINISKPDKGEISKHKDSTSQYDMAITVMDLEEIIILNFRYCTKLFKSNTIDRYFKYFKNILSGLSVSTDIKLSDIKMVTDEEQSEIMNISTISRR